MQKFLALLNDLNPDLSAEEIADVLWLASYQPSTAAPVNDVEPEANKKPKQPTDRSDDRRNRPPFPGKPAKSAAVSMPPTPQQPRTDRTSTSGLPFQAPMAPALRNCLELGRSLRPLMRKVPSRTEQILDEEATAIAIAESPQHWQPVLQAAPERWLDLALVVEDTRSTMIWQELIAEVQQLLERQGAFRTVRVWSLRSTASDKLELSPRRQTAEVSQRSRSPNALLDYTGRQLILLLSDCVSPLWRRGTIHSQLQAWASISPTTIIQLFPERLWARSALGLGAPVALRSFAPGVLNSQLEVIDQSEWETVSLTKALTLPIVTLEPDSLEPWARMVSGLGNVQTAGALFDLDFVAAQSRAASGGDRPPYTAEELVQRFRTTASPLARRLAALMSVVPVSLPVVHLIQEAMLPASRQVHVAEIFMSGLLRSELGTQAATTSEPVRYEFVKGVRELLQEAVPKTEVLRVMDKVAEYIGERAGVSTRSFSALLMRHSERGQLMGEDMQQFAELSMQMLQRMGGECAAFAEEIQETRTRTRQALEGEERVSYLDLLEAQFARLKDLIAEEFIEGFASGSREFTIESYPEELEVEAIEEVTLMEGVAIAVNILGVLEHRDDQENEPIFEVLAEVSFRVDLASLDREAFITEIHEDSYPTISYVSPPQLVRVTAVVNTLYDGQLEIESIQIRMQQLIPVHFQEEISLELGEPDTSEFQTFEFEMVTIESDRASVLSGNIGEPGFRAGDLGDNDSVFSDNVESQYIDKSATIRVIGPRASGKTTYMAALARWVNANVDSPVQSVNVGNVDTEELVYKAQNILEQGLPMEPTMLNLKEYLLSIVLKVQPSHRWFKKNSTSFVALSIAYKEYSGEFFSDLLHNAGDFVLGVYLEDCAKADGLMLLFDGNTRRRDAEYANGVDNLLASLDRFNINRSLDRSNINSMKRRIVMVLTKCEVPDLWASQHQSSSAKLAEARFPQTYRKLKSWQDSGSGQVEFFVCSAFGVLGAKYPEPNSKKMQDEYGMKSVIKDPKRWRPFGLVAPIYWLCTGQRHKDLEKD
jgi:hypothetical protein